MKKKVIILGSTGSIGKITLRIIKKDKKKFKIMSLSTNKNVTLIKRQAKEFNVRNIIITDYKSYLLAKRTNKKHKLNIYNSFDIISKIFKKKEIDYSLVSIVGLDGLKPSIDLIKLSKNIGIINKESLICGWNLISRELKKFKTNFIPLDSEHFSIFNLIDKNLKIKIQKIFITASGGPFLNYNYDQFYKIKIKDALNHPNWSMGNKITIDSSTMMNKVFEIIEAKNIFGLKYSEISFLIHQNSYVHAIVKFNNGLSKFLIHEPDMRIPLHNFLYPKDEKKFFSKKLNFEILNNLNFSKINKKKFPLIKILNLLPKTSSLYETALVTINDFFVHEFLNNKIDYMKMINSINYHANSKYILKLRRFSPKSITEIEKIRNKVSLKLNSLSVYKPNNDF